MSQYTVTIQQITSAIDTLTQLNSEFKTATSNLETTEGQLCSMWEGEARDTFDAAFKKDKTQMDNFYNAIQQYINVLTQAKEKYLAAEQANTETASTRNY
ncbi:MAG TPA: WXG100 family type VII secretion target [Candidatus Flavonifractor merdigallinarum]|uniref:ESAT-6-like protein n=1 Tax=Candidatus Flavonifractor merdigallinarum TaxID=2838589 RepID=A0A9D2C029_9FIRM|nr:WXG100 family type VII secretion target [Candidatus Flavonifractor merdigallinarum]